VAQRMTVGFRRRWVIIAVAAIILLGVVLSALSGIYVDLLWFREVHFSGVFWSVFWSKVVLGLVFGVLFFVLLLANLIVVRRITPRFRVPSMEQEIFERYRPMVEPYIRYLVPGFAALIALFVGIAASAQWQTFLLWRSAGPVRFGANLVDPVFHRDPSFYIFVLPFHKFVQGWLFSSLVGILVIVILAHYVLGNIRTQQVADRVTPAARGHLSVLLGLIILVKAWGYYLGKFDLLVSSRGVVTGASYTDLHAQLPALKLLVFVAIFCAVLFFVNIRYRVWALPIIALGLLVLVSVIAGAVVPAAVQRFQVTPQELQKETPYITRDIDATRYAFGIGLKSQPVNPANDITAAEVQENDLTISNIRLWNPGILGQTYQALQRIQPYYEFSDVDVDRYGIQAEERMVMLSAREVSQAGIPGGAGWQSSHLIYTHGYGAVASRVSSATGSGAPEFLLKDVPASPGSQIQLDPGKGSQVYYGELHEVPYVIVDTKQRELNFPRPNGPGSVFTTYRGKGGIAVGGFFRRLVFAYRYRDFNLLISGLITPESRILINRDVRTRIRKAAPFLKYDADPYSAIVGGHLFYVWDAYTTTDLYPYSERVSLSDVTNGDVAGRANYIRNSVKAVMNAYDGTVRFYVTAPADPLIQVWQRAFPHLFTPLDQAPAELQAHFRYPEDLMQIQAQVFSRYHVDDAATFFNNAERWAVPEALPPCPDCAASGTLRPYYVLLRLPGDEREQFVLFQPFTPAGRQNMVAYMAAGSDPGLYGRLDAFQFPVGENIDGPQQVRNLISQDPAVSQQLTLLSQKGSNVLFGDLIITPIENGFLYVQPVFVTASNTNPIPELKRVVVVHGGAVSIATSLGEALTLSFGQPFEPGPTPGPGPGPQPTGRVAQLLARAQRHFTAAQDALTRGDLATYQREIDAGIALVNQAAQASSSPSPTPSATPSASAPPSALPSPSPTPTG
jgi:uncharacterized protein